MTTTRLQRKKEQQKDEEKVGGIKKDVSTIGRSKGMTGTKAPITGGDNSTNVGTDVAPSFDAVGDLAALSALKLDSSGGGSGGDATTGRTRTSKSSRKRKGRSVSFSVTTVHYMDRTLSMQTVPGEGGFPLGLGQEIDSVTLDVDTYQQQKQRNLWHRLATMLKAMRGSDAASALMAAVSLLMSTISPLETRNFTDFREHGEDDPQDVRLDRALRNLFGGSFSRHPAIVSLEPLLRQCDYKNPFLYKLSEGEREKLLREDTDAISFTEEDVQANKIDLDTIRSNRMKKKQGCSCCGRRRCKPGSKCPCVANGIECNDECCSCPKSCPNPEEKYLYDRKAIVGNWESVVAKYRGVFEGGTSQC